MYVCLWQADSGFFCEGYSSDEDVLLKEEFRGNIIKQGCLLKQVNFTVFFWFDTVDLHDLDLHLRSNIIISISMKDHLCYTVQMQNMTQIILAVTFIHYYVQ